MEALSRWRSETTRVVPSLLESWASWLFVPSAASMLDPLALDVAISCVNKNVDACDINRGGARKSAGRQLLPIIPELFSIPVSTYYSQNYSGIISASLAVVHTTIVIRVLYYPCYAAQLLLVMHRATQSSWLMILCSSCKQFTTYISSSAQLASTSFLFFSFSSVCHVDPLVVSGSTNFHADKSAHNKIMP